MSTATATEPPPPSTSTMASWLAPAKTMVDSPMAMPPPRWASTGAAPATRPKGMTPMSSGVTAITPARNSSRFTRPV